LLEQLLTVADGVERTRSGANRTNSGASETLGYPASCGELLKVGAEGGTGGINSVEVGKAVLDSVLATVVACGHLAAEAVASVGYGHSLGIVSESVDENRDVQISKAERVCDGPFVAKVWKSDENTVDLVAVSPEEICAGVGFGKGFN
jgi:hypothetical protein